MAKTRGRLTAVNRILLALPALILPFALADTADAAGSVPADCAVPPDIDLTQFNVIIGTNASETLRGTTTADFICARLGSDVVFGYGGNDLILGDTTTFFGDPSALGGGDIIFAGAGADQVLSGPGNDRVWGEAGRDFLALAVGNDTGSGGAGADEMIGGFGRDTLDGGTESDTIAGGPDADALYGGSGEDTLFGELPGGGLPPGVPGARDVCNGGYGLDTGTDCDVRNSL